MKHFTDISEIEKSEIENILLEAIELKKSNIKTKLRSLASMKNIRVANGQGFWGDCIEAPTKLIKYGNRIKHSQSIF